MRKILTYLWISQFKKTKNGFSKERYNPYNPLSYIFILLMIIGGVLIVGLPQVIEDLKSKNPFKYNYP